MVLLNSIIQILAVTNEDTLEWSARFGLQAVLGVACDDCLPVGLASVNDNAGWPAVVGYRLAKKAFPAYAPCSAADGLVQIMNIP